MQLSEHVYLLTILDEHGAIHLALIASGDNLALIDTGFPGQYDAISAAIEAEGFSPSQITHIVLTHQDMDHVGTILDIKRNAPAAIVCAHEIEALYIEGKEMPVKLQAMLARGDALPTEQRVYIEKMIEGAKRFYAPVDRYLVDADTLPGFPFVRVLHTPGHTPGHICLLVYDDEKILISGDALNVEDGKLTGPKSEHSLDMQLALQSLRPLLEMNIDKVIAYHGGLCQEGIHEQLQDICSAK